jgi:transposase
VTNLDKDKSADFLISCYLSRRKVESAFHYLKGFIEIRPFYHHKEDRIKSHILVCILSYLLQITLENLLKKKGYNFTFREFVNKVREVKAVELEIKNVKKRDIKLTEIQEEIKRILKDLNMEELMYENFIKKLI